MEVIAQRKDIYALPMADHRLDTEHLALQELLDQDIFLFCLAARRLVSHPGLIR